MNAKKNGITRTEIAEILTHAAFYAGWPKAWAAFRMAKGIWTEAEAAKDAKAAHQREMVFPIEFGYRNNWPIHHANSGGGQILICVAGQGLVSGVGQARPGPSSRRGGQHSRRDEALARCGGK